MRVPGSQFKEDEIIADLLRQYKPKSKVCCDIGARGLENGSNIYKLVHDGWRGYYYDKGSNKLTYERLPELPKGSVYFLQTVTIENINSIVPSDVSILSIDIDGNDYHIWEALKHEPDIVIIECDKKAKFEILPYDPKSPKRRGSGPEALTQLGHTKGYELHKITGVNLIFTHNNYGGI